MNHILAFGLITVTYLGACSQRVEKLSFERANATNTDEDAKGEGNKKDDETPAKACDALDTACLALSYPEGSKCEVKFPSAQDGPKLLTNEEIKNSLKIALGMDFSQELSDLPRRDQGSKFENAIAKSPLGQNFVDNWLDISFNISKRFVENSAAFGRLVTCSEVSRGCSDTIIKAVAPKLWRQEIKDMDLEAGFKVFSTAKSDFKEAAIRQISAIILDPRFLYKMSLENDSNQINAYELASRMAFFLWRSSPDAILLSKAKDGSLLKPQVRNEQMERMMASPQAEIAFRAFMQEWLALGNIDNLQIQGEVIDPQGKRKDVLDKLASQVFHSENDFRNAFGKGEDNVLTMPGVLGSLNVSSKTSPVKRGLYFSSRILCRKVPPPPGNAGAFKAETLSVDATPRERLRLHETDPTCASCHSTVDPIGLGLETFDAIGRVRMQYDSNIAIDTSGQMKLDGESFKFKDASSMMKAIGGSEDLAACMTVTLNEYAIGSSPETQNSCELSQIHQAFAKGGYQWKALVQAIIESPSFSRKVSP